MNTSGMTELSAAEMQAVDGGIIPLLLAGAAILLLTPTCALY